MGLGKIADALSRLESHAISVHARQCVRLRHRKATCSRCADACPTHAISWDGSLDIALDKCSGCGLCAAVCPSGALEAIVPTHEKLGELIETRVKEPAPIAFACPRYLGKEGDRTHTISVSCVGRLDESLLIHAVAAGAKSVWLADGVCAECPTKIGQAIAAQSVQTANKLLQAWNVRPRIELISDLPAETQTPIHEIAPAGSMSRREFFKRLAPKKSAGQATQASSVASDTHAPGKPGPADADEPKKGAPPIRLPRKQRMLLSALQRLGKPAVTEIESSLWAQFAFQESCTGCQMCAFFCPTGALTKIEQEGQVGVAFRLAYCTNCGLCQAVCYRNAVTLSCTVDLSKVFENRTDTYLMQPAGARGQPGCPQEKFKRLFKTNQE